MKRANFAGSNLAGVTLFGADLSDADFTARPPPHPRCLHLHLHLTHLLRDELDGFSVTKRVSQF